LLIACGDEISFVYFSWKLLSHTKLPGKNSILRYSLSWLTFGVFRPF
jgi:hypothetical protein